MKFTNEQFLRLESLLRSATAMIYMPKEVEGAHTQKVYSMGFFDCMAAIERELSVLKHESKTNGEQNGA